jgi:hypothetical protein
MKEEITKIKIPFTIAMSSSEVLGYKYNTICAGAESYK